jgi:adenine-specific DNA methylase
MNNSNNKRAIEESFPIVEINRLAVPERNAFKPIYQMHKWFARRASCVFRAILLGAMKPAGTDIMAEFYKNHTHDPDTMGVKILDPFMGGGTTIVEALRLGCHVTGIDLNPVAWFIVKTEVEPVDIEELRAAFKRLEERATTSGKSVKDELLSHYKTECPCCAGGNEEADIIYTFWVKSAICTNPTCRKEVPLFPNYIIAQKTASMRFLPDYICTSCKKAFDLDMDRASLIAEEPLMVNNPRDSAGIERSNKRWAYYDPLSQSACCPWCSHTNKFANISVIKKDKKKVSFAVIYCPQCGSVFQYRGGLPDNVNCPACTKAFDPNSGNMSEKGKFVCQTCGNKDAIINSIRKLPKNSLLPVRLYAIEGYCQECAGRNNNEDQDLYGRSYSRNKASDHVCNIHHNNGKFFKRITASDLKRYQDAEKRWEKEKSFLPYPKSKIPVGEKTKSGLIAHHYYYWQQMFNPRQMLCLSTLLKAIGEEENQVLKEMLLSAFQMCLEANNMFARYRTNSGGRSPFGGLFSRHDYQPKITPCEISVFGPYEYYGSYKACAGKVIAGKVFNLRPFDYYSLGVKRESRIINEKIDSKTATLICVSSSSLNLSNHIDFIVTDPPYSGNVNYSELADFFYVWLRLILSKSYPQFSPEMTPKAEEIIENPTRGKTSADYEQGLTEVWRKCNKHLKDDGLMVFTFHHSEGSAWEALLRSLCNSGFVIEAIYPIHSESESSLHLLEKQAISYDLIHICRRINGKAEAKQSSWATARQEIRQKAREEIKLIEAGRYGSERLSAADANIVLIGKCLEIYSKHYGQIVDYKGEVVPLAEALSMIRIMVEQIISAQQPLPSELEHVDPASYVYLTCLCDRKEIQSDEVHKVTRGLIELDALMKAGVIRKGRARRGRTYEVKLPGERFKDLQKLFENKFKSTGQILLFPELEEARFERIALVDTIHYLMGLVEARENLLLYLDEFRSILPQIRVSLSYLREKNPTFLEPINKILALIEV